MEFINCTQQFQFHTGSIKSYSVHSPHPILVTFQFHTGSIKSQNTNA